MSFGATIAKVAAAAVAVELRGVVRRFVRGLKGKAPHAESSQPWPGSDVIHKHNQAKAGAENFRGGDTQRLPRPTMRPPPLKRPR